MIFWKLVDSNAKYKDAEPHFDESSAKKYLATVLERPNTVNSANTRKKKGSNHNDDLDDDPSNKRSKQQEPAHNQIQNENENGLKQTNAQDNSGKPINNENDKNVETQ